MNLALKSLIALAIVLTVNFVPPEIVPGPVGEVIGVQTADAQRAGRRNRDESTGQGDVSQNVADAFNEALEMFEAGNLSGAEARVRAVLDGAGPFEQSIIFRFLGQIAIDREDLGLAAQYFQQAISSGGLEGEDLAQLYLVVGQIYAADGQYDRALTSLNQYFSVVEEPEAQAFYVLAQVYAVAGRIREAVDPALTAVRMTAEEPRETYIRLVMSLYLTLEEWSNALPYLQQLVGLAPEKDQYWQSLAGVYQQLGREMEAFAVHQFRYRMGFLDSSSDFETLADLYMYHGVPFKGAQILDLEISNGNVDADASNWEKLGNAWFAAREFERSRAALTRAANLSPDGQISYRIAGTYIQEENWSQARRWLERAIDQGDLDDAGQAWLLLGHARNAVDDYETAVAAFQRASNFAEWREDATTWLDVMENRRLAREADLANRQAYEAEAQDIIDRGETSAQLAEAAAGLAQEAFEQARLATQVSESERVGILEQARTTLAEAREADNEARDPDFGSEADVRERVREIGVESRADGNTALAENLEDASNRFLERRTDALTLSDQLIRDAEALIFEAQEL